MIDKNGKLFGKINLIDLIIIIVLIGLLAFAALKFVSSRNSGTELVDLNISFYSDEVPEFVTDYIEIGASVLDDNKDVTMGKVTGFEVGEPLGFATDANGEVQQVYKNGYKSLRVDMSAVGELGENGATIDGVLYGVGHTLTIYAGKAKLYIKISAIELAG
ncbi:MAG: DUF4330 family protein [Clostridiales bacterium]|nr:DUF4330 family protein [Clostridiales bacterium]